MMDAHSDMSAMSCCGAHPARRSILQRALQSANWIIPGSLLALMPKCPLCLAGYIALGTGMGISITTASHLRLAAITLCISWLAYQCVRLIKVRGWRSS